MTDELWAVQLIGRSRRGRLTMPMNRGKTQLQELIATWFEVPRIMLHAQEPDSITWATWRALSQAGFSMCDQPHPNHNPPLVLEVHCEP